MQISFSFAWNEVSEGHGFRGREAVGDEVATSCSSSLHEQEPPGRNLCRKKTRDVLVAYGSIAPSLIDVFVPSVAFGMAGSPVS